MLEGLQLIFVELPKFVSKKYLDKKLMVLWLRYLSEIENGTEMIDKKLYDELMGVPEIAQALELTKESAYTKAELEAYDKYWDSIRTEKTLIADAEAKGIRIGKLEAILVTAKKLKDNTDLSLDDIADITGLSLDDIKNL